LIVGQDGILRRIGNPPGGLGRNALGLSTGRGRRIANLIANPPQVNNRVNNLPH
jgi:hypothetical protein